MSQKQLRFGNKRKRAAEGAGEKNASRRADRARAKRPKIEFVGAGSGRRRAADGDGRALTRAQQRRIERRRRQVRLSLAMLAAIVLLLGLCGWQYAQYRDFQQMRAAVEVETFFDGTHVEGIDVSEMTLAQALAHWAENVEPAYAGRGVTLSDGTRVTAAMVGYRSNYEAVLRAAYRAGREGGIAERYEAIGSLESGVEYLVTRTPYTQEGIDACVAALAAGIDCEPTQPTMSGFDGELYQFVYSGGKVGKELDQEALRRDLADAFAEGLESVTLSIAEALPTLPTDEYGIISIYKTNAHNSSSARLHNISLALKTINGTRLAPGEIFSFNGVVGQRTKAKGYREAKAYYGMRDILEVGGGICQVSSTLYACALGAQMEIVERHEHGRRVYYIPVGKDATVDWGHKDLKFSNNRDEEVYVLCRMDEGDNVYIAIFGKLQEGDFGLSEQGREMSAETVTLALE